MYPDADVPVLELSIDLLASPRSHVELASRLGILRHHGVLILGSGNIVHNLGRIDWRQEHTGYTWAVEFDEWARDRISAGDLEALQDYEKRGPQASLAVPTDDHYLPLLYAMAVREGDEPITFTYAGMELGSISMRCVRVG